MTALSRGGLTVEKKAISAWLYGPVTDLLVGCGAWSLPLLMLAYAASQRAAGLMALAFYVLAVLCNNPHYMQVSVHL